MIAVNQIAKTLYEQILSLHEFVDPNINKQFYLNRLEYFKQLPLLLEDILFIFTNVSSKVKELVLTMKPNRLYTLQKQSQQFNTFQQPFPTQINTQLEIKKKLTINSMGFGDNNNVLKERGINTKPVRKQRQSVEIPKEKQNKYFRQLKELKDLRQFREFPQIKQSKDFFNNRLLTTIDKEKYLKHSITENDECNNERYSREKQRDKRDRDPYGDEDIYMQNVILNNLREKNKEKDPTRKRKILSMNIKSPYSPNMFIN